MSVVHRRPGRPRDAQAEGVILDATLELLGELGFGGLTIDAVAARAGVGRATIYRRWEAKEDLVIAAAHRMADQHEAVDSGSVRDDLIGTFASLAKHLADPVKRGVVPALFGAAQHNPKLRAMTTAFANVRRNRARRILRNGIARGELPADTDIELVIDLVGGPIFYRLIVMGQTTSRANVEAMVDTVLSNVPRL